MNTPTIIHHGAVTGVTGSCHQYCTDTIQLLIDCGLFQGAESNTPLENFTFNPEEIDALIVTHGHIDHVGRIPWLIAAGFNNPILCSEPTAKLLPIILRDALEIQLGDHAAVVESTLAKIESLITPLPLNRWHSVSGSTRVRLQNAGHILGSVYVEVDSCISKTSSTSGSLKSHRTVFSGDLGSPGAVFVDGFAPPERADTLVIESTYGDKTHSSRLNREKHLAELVNKALKNKGTLLIPTFSLGRTQELIAMLENLLHEGLIEAPNGDFPLPIILDSPLAQEITTAYRSLCDYWPETLNERKDSSRKPLAFDQLISVCKYIEHKRLVERLANTGQPAIVIAASGMCQGGRIVRYMAALLEKPETDILFVGYQAKGTLGSAIQQSKPEDTLKIGSQKLIRHAAVHTISGFSAHADQTDLLSFACNMDENPKEIRLIHGSEDAKAVFREKLVSMLPESKVMIAS
jgi:metallo-beta-lactamase family protein